MIKGISDHADKPGNREMRKANTFAAATNAAEFTSLVIPEFINILASEVPGELQPKTSVVREGRHQDLDGVLQKMDKYLSRFRPTVKRPLIVKNLAVDGAKTIPWLMDYLDHRNPKIRNVDYRVLLLDYRSRAVLRYTGEARVRANGIKETLRQIEALNELYKERNIVITPRLYRRCMPIHGFQVAGKLLLISNSIIGRDTLDAGVFPYKEFELGFTPTGDHFHKFFESWFDMLWLDAVPNVTPVQESPLLVFGHRGGRRKGGVEENTFEAIQWALEEGAHGVEVDARVTSDKVPVLLHDDVLERTTNISGPVIETDWLRVSKAKTDRECSVPTLADAAKLVFGRNASLMLEIKDFGNWEEIAAVAVGSALENEGELILASFDHSILKVIKAAHPEFRTCAILDGALVDPVEFVATTECDIVSIGTTAISSRLISEFKATGVDVFVWTVNSPSEAMRLHNEGVNGVISDRPDLMSSIVSVP